MVLRSPSSQLVCSFQPSAASFLSQMKYLPCRVPGSNQDHLSVLHLIFRLALLPSMSWVGRELLPEHCAGCQQKRNAARVRNLLQPNNWSSEARTAGR